MLGAVLHLHSGLSFDSALAVLLYIVDYRFDMSLNPVVGVTLKNLHQTAKHHCLLVPVIGCKIDTSPRSTVVECGWCVCSEVSLKIDFKSDSLKDAVQKQFNDG